MSAFTRIPMFGVAALFLALQGPAAATPFDDAVAAYKAGDFGKAASLFERLAKAGDPQAEHNLGFLYHAGKGVARNDATAMIWYRKAAEQGFAASQFNLGVMYQEGESVPPDMDLAVAWYQKAASQNYLEAEEKLSTIYLAKKDFAGAIVWLRKAASRAPRARSSISARSITTAGARRRTMQRRAYGTPRPPHKAFPAPRTC